MDQKARSIIPDITVSSSKAPKGVASRIRRLKVQHPEFSDSEIARVVGCKPSNVCRVLQRFLGESSREELAEYQANKADIFDRLAVKTLESINDDVISKAPYLARVTGAAILEDKSRLVRGQSTQNVAVLVEAVEMIREMRASNLT